MNSLVNHVFLPSILPGTEDQCDDELMRVFNENIQSSKAPDRVKKAFDNWKTSQTEDSIVLDNSADDTVVYLKHQNCAVVLSKTKSDRLILSDFQCARTSEDVMKEPSCYSAFPFSSVEIPNVQNWDLLEEQLYEMGSTLFSDSMVTATKSGKQFKEVRDVSKPTRYSQIKTVLMDAKSCEIKELFVKKLRDDVIWKSSVVPFRRSGYYMSMKVVLMLLLSRELSKEESLIVYKTILLNVHSSVYEETILTTYPIAKELLTKMARRVYKLKNLVDKNLKLDASKDALEVIKMLNQKLSIESERHQSNWEAICNSDVSKSYEVGSIDFKDLIFNFTPTIHHSQSNTLNVPPTLPLVFRHTSESFFDSKLLLSAKSSEEIQCVLFDFESWLLIQGSGFIAEGNATHWKVLLESHAKHLDFCQSDPFCFSRFLLCQLLMVSLLDKCVILSTPMYAEHKPSINPLIIDSLLLQTKKEFEIAFEVQTYFKQRNNALYDGLLEGISTNSFPYRYAQANWTEYISIYMSIQAADQKDEIAKEKEIQKAVQLHDERMYLKATLEHEYYIDRHSGERKHGKCEKCHNGVLARDMKVSILEKRLSYNDMVDKCVLFELNSPQDILYMRDVLFDFNSSIGSINKEVNQHFGEWRNRLARYNKGSISVVQPCSSVKAFTTSHYKTLSINTNSRASKYIVNCAFNFKYSVNQVFFCYTPNFNLNLGFKLTSAYSIFQFCLNTTNYSQNSIIAMQYKCPQEMLLREFMAFGNLRSGSKLQWRHLYRFIRDLNFNDESVVYLIMTSIFKCESNSIKHWIRSAHYDLTQSDFIKELLGLLKNLMTENKDNWKNYNLVIALVFICRRISTIGYQEECQDIFTLVRTTMDKWQEKLIGMLNKDPSNTVIVTIIHYSHVIVCLTFDNSFFNVQFAFLWLKNVVNFNEKQLLNPINIPCVYLNLIRSIGFGLSSFFKTKDGHSALIQFIESHYNNCTMKMINSVDYIYCLKAENDFIVINIVYGTFLVNSAPKGLLPNRILNHPNYKRLFDKSLSIHPHGNGYLAQIYSVQFYIQYFPDAASYEQVQIQEFNNATKKTHQYVPNELFSNLPFELEKSFAWVNIDDNHIEFRNKMPKFTKEITHAYYNNQIVKYSQGLDQDVLKKQENLIIPFSDSWAKIVATFQPIELPENIRVYFKESLTIYLYKYKLHFLMKGRKYYCKELDMYLSDKPLGTLVELKTKLVLENDFGEMAVIVPFGSLEVDEKDYIKYVVNLKTLGTFDPITKSYLDPYHFIYKVDPTLRRLKGNQTTLSWLYLTYLHAFTNDPMADPLTMLTGHEQAITLLRSAMLKNNEPYSPAEFVILERIAKLSPQRRYYPSHLKVMQEVKYLHFSRVYFDGYYLLVRDLIQQSMQLQFLFSPSEVPKIIENDSELLNRQLNASFCKWSPHARLSNSPAIINSCFLPIPIHPDLQLLVNACRSNTFPQFNLNLEFLKSMDQLYLQLENSNFLSCWLYYYSIAISDISVEEWLNVLLELYRNKVPIDDLLTLQRIRAAKSFIPKMDFKVKYTQTKECRLIEKDIMLCLEGQTITFEKYCTLNSHLHNNEEQLSNKFRKFVEQEQHQFTFLCSDSYPFLPSSSDLDNFQFLTVSTIVPTISSLMTKWDDNYKLHQFVISLTKSLTMMKPSNITIPILNSNKSIQSQFQNMIEFDFKLTSNSYNYYQTGTISNLDKEVHQKYFELSYPTPGECPFVSEISKIHSHMVFQIQKSWDSYSTLKVFGKFQKKEYIAKHGQLLKEYEKIKTILQKKIYSKFKYPPCLDYCMPKCTPMYLLGQLTSDPDDLIGSYAVVLTYIQQCQRVIKYAELDKINHIQKESMFQFNPCKHPEWVKLQLEMDVMFRRNQVDLATNLKDITQLQMGEGKTSVILPMLCTRDKPTQIVVLKSLFHLNIEIKFKLGYLINKQVFVLPCHRKIELDESKLQCLMSQYKSIVDQNQIILTTPEYLQSFHLKCIEISHLYPSQVIELRNYISTQLTTILDESDEILHYKHQLVYTLGSQSIIDGGQERYVVIEKVLLTLFDNVFKADSMDALARQSNKLQFVNKIIDKGHLYFPDVNKKNMVKFITDPSSTQRLNHPTLLVLRGLFSCDLLFHAFKKRFRVNYGLDLSFRQMSIPFKAKDTPTENTEFGHPDMGIILTLLSYYQYGLNNKQLGLVYDLLQQLQYGMDYIYAWTGHQGQINLLDESFKLELFEKTRKNMACIHFYLNQFVFPKELKQFPYLLVSTGWDIKATSGFSGTNDTELLLPNMKQNNLESLLHTNAQVLVNILQNKRYYHNVNILDTVVNNNIQLIIDCGALFEIGNRQVAEEWLKIAEDEEACLYFEEDRLQVIDKFGHVQKYENSAYKDNLKHCLIYLDDHHCRGVDLQLPVNYKGLATISHDLCKDKFVQSCMRMRLLGSTHSLSFLASQKAHLLVKIQEDYDVNPVMAIIRFVLQNTVRQVEDNFFNWAQAGLYHFYKECAYDLFTSRLNGIVYKELCQVPEYTELSGYLEPRNAQSILELVDHTMQHYIRRLLPYNLNQKYVDKCQFIVDHVGIFVNDVKHFKQTFNDEQQRELEHEVEEEHQKYRPEAAKAIKEEWDPVLMKFILNEVDFDFKPFHHTLNKPMNDTKLVGTFNFFKTVDKMALDYLREPLWIIQSRGYTILITPYEANKCISACYGLKDGYLMMYQPQYASFLQVYNTQSLVIGHYYTIDLHIMMHLFLYSGGLYFSNKEEQDMYLKIIGFVCRPRNSKEEEIFEKGGIINNYLSTEYHEQLGMKSLFQKNEVEFIKHLIEVRNRYYREDSHVGKVLMGAKHF